MTHALVEQSKLLTKTSVDVNLHIDEVTLCDKNATLKKKDQQNNYERNSLTQDEEDQNDEFFDCRSSASIIEDGYSATNICHCLKPHEIVNGHKTLDNGDSPCSLSGGNHSKHLFPFVVVNPSQELSDLDSDEEDYQIRTNTCRTDSGQGSSVETSSLKSNTNEFCNSIEDKNNSFDMNRKNKTNQNPDNDMIDVLLDMNVTTDDDKSFPTPRTTSISARISPQTDKKISSSSFTEIPLHSHSPSKAVNTFKPSKHSLDTNDSVNGLMHSFRPPVLTDTQPKTRLLNRSNQQKSWKIFGKVAVSVAKEPSPQASPRSRRKDRKETVGSSTTALILENRPSYLPPKSVKEEKKHREQYEEMIAFAKRKEIKDKESEKKRLKQRRKHEDQLYNTAKVWKEEIIPEWETCKNTKKVRDLWWSGIPPSVRGAVWKLAIGNDLHMTTELFLIFQEHARERVKNQKYQEPVAKLHNSESSLIVSKENTIGLITLDVSRTFPSLCIFQKGGPYHEPLKNLLAAYTCHRPDVGYVQGMSFLAATLLLNMDVTDAFITFTNLLSRSCQMAFFTVDQAMMEAYYRTFDVLLEDQLPRLHVHFKMESLSHDIYLIDWIFTLFSKSLPLDTACRVWDLFCRDGEEFLFRTALGILLMYQDALLEMEFFRLAQYLTKLSNTITPEELFHYIEKINFSKQKFQHTLNTFKTMVKATVL